jgi:hypothetical protein
MEKDTASPAYTGNGSGSRQKTERDSVFTDEQAKVLGTYFAGRPADKLKAEDKHRGITQRGCECLSSAQIMYCR